MKGHWKYFTLGAIIIICQILISEYVNIWTLLYIAIFPQFIILLPPMTNRSLYMVIAFVLGLGIDLFADGVPGLNAAALVAMAYSRPAIMNLIFSKSNFENTENTPLIPRYIEIHKLFILNLLMLAVFFTVYILIDSAASFPFWYTILGIVACVVANTVISMVCSSVLLNKILS